MAFLVVKIITSVFAANINLKPQAAGFPVQTAYRGPVHCISSILRKEGLAGIYRGAGAMVLRDVPGYCLYFIPYTFLCEWFTSDGRRSPSPSSVWIAGGIAGMDLSLLSIGKYINRKLSLNVRKCETLSKHVSFTVCVRFLCCVTSALCLRHSRL